ncbi:MAG: hypothetical protein HYY06_07485 [Deltaproteobacteria bacterium]|nr:hypothetical protein [Deltaproteobacteria bacterium]
MLALLALAGCPDLGDPPADAGSDARAADASLDAAAVGVDAAPDLDAQGDARSEDGSPDAMPDSPVCPDEPVSVEMSYMRFVPGDVTVQVGCPVLWTNRDGTNAHDVTSGTPELPTDTFSSGDLRNGDTFTHTFETAGSFVYHCAIHPDVMRDATITVE